MLFLLFPERPFDTLALMENQYLYFSERLYCFCFVKKRYFKISPFCFYWIDYGIFIWGNIIGIIDSFGIEKRRHFVGLHGEIS